MRAAVARPLAVASLAIIAALAAPGPSPMAQPAGRIGGFDLDARATLVSVQLIGSAQPQTELSLGSTNATSATGPGSRATASWLSSGAGAAGEPTKVEARHPAGPGRQDREVAPGSGLTASSDATATRSGVTVADTPAPAAAPGLPALPALPALPGLPILPALPGSTAQPGLDGLVTAKAATSTSENTVGAGEVTSRAFASAGSIALLGGLISIDGVEVRSVASSTGSTATADGVTTVAGVTVAGQRLPIGGVTDRLTETLAVAGISVVTAPATRQVDGATGTAQARSMEISVDTGPLRANLGGLLAPLGGLLSPGQLDSLLGMAGKMVFVVGDARAAAKAAAVPPPAAPAPGAGDTVGGGGNVGGGGGFQPGFGVPGAGADVPLDTVPDAWGAGMQTPVTVTGSKLPGLTSIPPALLTGAVALAAAIGWGLRRTGGLVLAAAGFAAPGLASSDADADADAGKDER